MVWTAALDKIFFKEEKYCDRKGAEKAGQQEQKSSKESKIQRTTVNSEKFG
jgi:hypothetical protein